MATIRELQAQAKELGIKGYGRLSKEQLESRVQPAASPSSPEDSPPTSPATAPRQASGPLPSSARIPCTRCAGQGVPLKNGGYMCDNCALEWRP